jgi:hypothetical protein
MARKDEKEDPDWYTRFHEFNRLHCISGIEFSALFLDWLIYASTMRKEESR